jgi:hypothetical protein
MKKGKQRAPYLKLDIRPVIQKFDMNSIRPDALEDIENIENPRVEIEILGEITTTMALEVARAVEKVMKEHGKTTQG